MRIDYSYFFTKQSGPAGNLRDIIERHLQTSYAKPIADHQYRAFEQLIAFIAKENRPIVIDSCCGTGLSTSLLAEAFPKHWVVGIDKSSARLSRHKSNLLNNFILLHADVIDLWRLISQAVLPVTHHFLFFPNPWPKKDHIKRRFHAHPIFSTMAGLSPYFEMRTNWQIYAEECAQAFEIIGQEVSIEIKRDNNYHSLFEKKYLETSCPVFIVKSINNKKLLI